MVAVNSVAAVGDEQHQRFDAFHIQRKFLGRIFRLHQAAVPDFFAVGLHLENDRAASALVVHAGVARQHQRVAVHFEGNDGVGVHANAVRVGLPGDGQAPVVHRTIGAALAIALLDTRDIQR